MALVFIFLVVIVPFTISLELEVRRGKQFDSVVWDGDCRKINGYKAEFHGKKSCYCKKIIKMNGIVTTLNGTLYPSNNGFLTCLYYFRQTGKSEIQINIPSRQEM